ncbi:MAG: hypothetical protein MUE40_16130, partial [Anaerolineae bacterium]|nr:hypothetical protein [Anaerolineae bacterium]
MTDEFRRGVRRFGRKDRKDRLPPAAPLFPPEPPAPPDFDALLPDSDPNRDRDREALQLLAALPPEAVRPLKIVPPEQRYPPLPPDLPPPPPERRPVSAAPAGHQSPGRGQGRGRRTAYNLVTLLAL